MLNIFGKNFRGNIINSFRYNVIGMDFSCKRDILSFFDVAVSSVDPIQIVDNNFRLKEDAGSKYLNICDKSFDILNKNIHLVGFGKAVYLMSKRCEEILGKNLKNGLVSVPIGTLEQYSQGSSINPRVKVFEGAKNNLPDQDSCLASREILELAEKLDENDLLLVLVSGGGSALFSLPVPGITIEDKVSTIKLLQSVGADITEINTIRTKLSIVKGGGLAEAAYPCKIITLILSDVINDPLNFIASGPTVLNTDSKSAAIDIIRKYKLEFKIPRHILTIIKTENKVTKLPVDKRQYKHVSNFIIGNNKIALKSVENYVRNQNYSVLKLSSDVEGYVHNISRFYAMLCLKICKMLFTNDYSEIQNVMSGIRNQIPQTFTTSHNFILELEKQCMLFNQTKGLLIFAGGETTVKINGRGKGGRNQELALWFSQMISELYINNNFMKDFDVMFLSAGTDGIDGPTDVAGAIGGKFISDSAEELHLNIDEYLANNDSYHFYSQIDNGSFFVKTGHTGTNVMDIHIIMITRHVKSKI